MKKNHQPSKAWYHYPFVWLLFGLPCSAVVAGLYTFYLAAQTSDGLVDDDYYKHGNQINEDISRDLTAQKMGISAQLILGEDQRNIRVILNQPIREALYIKLLHPTRAGFDQQSILQMQSPQLWSITLQQPLTQKHWLIEISDSQKKWRLRGAWSLDQQAALTLKTTPTQN